MEIARFFFLFLLAACGVKSCPNVQELPPTKQKQKISLLQKKLHLAEKEQRKIKHQIDRLNDEMRETELAYIRKKIDDYEDLIRKNPKLKATFDSSDLFLEEREKLHKIIQTSESSFEAQVVLDRILQLVTELGDAVS